jgi:hypothetical protein
VDLQSVFVRELEKQHGMANQSAKEDERIIRLLGI